MLRAVLQKAAGVLIESDWNLKYMSKNWSIVLAYVLIESDWNLKVYRSHISRRSEAVLIESDWNLKHVESVAISRIIRY